MFSRQLFEHNISQYVALCFVSTKAAVRRKSLASLWIAALPTESGTEPGERREESLEEEVRHYVPSVYIPITK